MDEVEYISSQDISEIFKTLGHPMRVSIITQIAEKSIGYTTLQKVLNNPSTGTLNFHLRKLDPLLQKDEDKYRLNEFGRKAYQLIQDYTQAGEEQPRQIFQKKTNYWEQFMLLSEGYSPIVIIAVFLLMAIFAWVLSLLQFDVAFQMLSILVGTTILWRWIWEKVYHSSESRQIFIASLITFLVASTLFSLYLVVGRFYQELITTVISLERQTTVPVDVDTIIGPLLDQLPQQLNFVPFLQIYIIAIVGSLIWVYGIYGELPNILGVGVQSEVSQNQLLVSTMPSLSFIHFLVLLVSTLVAEIFIFTFFAIVRIATDNYSEYVILLPSLQVLWIMLLFGARGLVMYYIWKKYGWPSYLLGKPKYLQWYILPLTGFGLFISQFLLQVSVNPVNSDPTYNLFASDLILLSNLLYGLCLFGLFVQITNRTLWIRKPMCFLLAIIFLMIATFSSLQNPFLTISPVLILAIIAYFSLIGTLANQFIPSNRRQLKLWLSILPIILLGLYVVVNALIQGLYTAIFPVLIYVFIGTIIQQIWLT